MSYPSVDQLQKVLTEKVFHYAKDSKKAAGRALGTLVEIITFYSVVTLLRRPFAIFECKRVGVVSNHGNWFTSENHNKELKVLAQSYDWLLFLTDAGIAQFIDELLFHPAKELMAAKESFLASYTGKKGVNQFTKVQISLAADAALQTYFKSHIKIIEGWFNIIAPAGKRLAVLKDELYTLKRKNWREIHS